MVTNMATTRERDVETETETETTFHPARITPQTFQTLLDCYSTTARNVQRRKAMLKQQPKDSKKRKTSSPPLTKTNFDPAEERSIQDEVEKYLDLDRMRYETLPGTVWRREDEEGQGQGPRFTKEELVRIMEWKTKHGRPRPALLGMIRSNPEKLALKCTSAAMAALPVAHSTTEDEDEDDDFPKQSMDDLSPLRGVGPATASLILSIATTGESDRVQVPFFSDDTYLWLCVGEYPESTASSETVRVIRGGSGGSGKGPGSKFVKPNGELSLKYNVAEYRELWKACVELRERFAGAGAGDTVSMVDIEKVAYVLRNIAVSGFHADIDVQEVLHMTVEQADALSARLAGREDVKGECEGGDGALSQEENKSESEDKDKGKDERASRKSKRAKKA
ncbi:unnamed protein product [Penicillium manginii]